MSHSKITKRGYSYRLEEWFPHAKKYINTCVICGHKGYSPVIDDEGFCDQPGNGAIYTELKKTLEVLPLDELGRCEYCATVQDKQHK
ncbi:MAG: hypothetical protein J1G38_06965 [Clostridiales bacterium]|nr:hypothetical protein [Clostridiales bacterium]